VDFAKNIGRSEKYQPIFLMQIIIINNYNKHKYYKSDVISSEFNFHEIPRRLIVVKKDSEQQNLGPTLFPDFVAIR